METILLGNLRFQLPASEREKWFRAEAGEQAALDEFLRQAEAVARPKAICGAAGFKLKDYDRVEIGDFPFRSRVLRLNLENAGRAFPFVATCGVELEDWTNSQTEAPRLGWARTVTGLALGFALKSLEELLAQQYQTGRLGKMKPGSIPDWPLEQQRPLFALLGDVKAGVGVELRPDFFMRPIMTTSGIYFADPDGFEGCLLCPRRDCPGRVRPYDEGLYARKFRGSSEIAPCS